MLKKSIHHRNNVLFLSCFPYMIYFLYVMFPSQALAIAYVIETKGNIYVTFSHIKRKQVVRKNHQISNSLNYHFDNGSSLEFFCLSNLKIKTLTKQPREPLCNKENKPVRMRGSNDRNRPKLISPANNKLTFLSEIIWASNEASSFTIRIAPLSPNTDLEIPDKTFSPSKLRKKYPIYTYNIEPEIQAMLKTDEPYKITIYNNKTGEYSSDDSKNDGIFKIVKKNNLNIKRSLSDFLAATPTIYSQAAALEAHGFKTRAYSLLNNIKDKRSSHLIQFQFSQFLYNQGFPPDYVAVELHYAIRASLAVNDYLTAINGCNLLRTLFSLISKNLQLSINQFSFKRFNSVCPLRADIKK